MGRRLKSLPTLKKAPKLSDPKPDRPAPSPVGLEGSVVKPSKADVVLASALESGKIQYSVGLTSDGQRINFVLDDAGVIIRINYTPVVAMGGIDRDKELFIADGMRVIDTDEGDVLSNVARIISQIDGG